MGQLIIRDRVITEDPLNILENIKSSVRNGKLYDFKLSGNGIAVPCPDHSDGQEKHFSCFLNLKNDDIPYLFYHCFTCSAKGSFAKFVGHCFNKDEQFGEDWLIANYASDYVKHDLILPKISLQQDIKDDKILNESILDQFESYHPYMTKRKLSDDVIKKFDIKYDPKTRCIVFPVRDIKGNLRFLTRRSVDTKYFHIDDFANKKYIYLLDNVVKNNLNEVFVCESQLNALTLESWGYNAIALLGAGTSNEQMDELNKVNVRHWILCYDGDSAGERGEKRFLSKIRKDVFVDVLKLPKGKDVNDLEKEEFKTLLKTQLNI